MKSNGNVHSLVVSNVDIKLRDTNGMKGICSIVLNDMFVVHDIRIVENRRGDLIVVMPSKKLPDGRFRDTCNPTNKEARRIIENAILEKYREVTTLSDELLALLKE